MISLQNVSLAFLDHTVFDGINWLITERGRIGIVGDNGTGKTTLFRMILGEISPDSGSIEVMKGKSFGYLPQDLVELDDISLLEHLRVKAGISDLEHDLEALEGKIAGCDPQAPEHEILLRRYEAVAETYRIREGAAFDGRARRVLTGLGFSSADFTKPCAVFSGGWKMRIVLASILLSEPDVMLLDEPTNHLDTESMEWLESFLRDYRGTLLTISHDHMFLDKMVNQVVEIFRGKLTICKGNYSRYLVEKEKKIEALRKERELQKAFIKKSEFFIERFRYKATKAAQVQSRIKMLEKFDLIPEVEKAKAIRFHFPEAPRSGREVVTARGLTKAYDGRVVFSSIDVMIERGEKIALVGVNGAGKSTLSRLLSRSEEPDQGAVEYGLNVRPAFYSQESADNVDYRNTVWEEVQAVDSPMNDLERRKLLGAFLFSGDAVFKPVSVLSGGEKSRLALLKLLMVERNLLILDEPTNHLDIRTKDIFQKALLDYSGTVLIVSHDRHFLDELVGRVLEIRDGALHTYLGNYSYFIEKRSQFQQEAVDVLERATPAETLCGESGPKSKGQKRLEAETRKRRADLRREEQRRLKAVEAEISNLEKRKVELEEWLCDPAVLREAEKARSFSLELKEIDARLPSVMEEWETVMLKLEELG